MMTQRFPWAFLKKSYLSRTRLESLETEAKNIKRPDFSSERLELTADIFPGSSFKTGSPEFQAAAETVTSGSLAENMLSPEGTTSQPDLDANKATIKRFIVFLDQARGQGSVTQRAQALMRSLDVAGRPPLVYEQLDGFSLEITDKEAQRLRALGGVQSVEADAEAFLDPPIPGQPTTARGASDAISTPSSLPRYNDSLASSGETLPYGVRAVWKGQDISRRGDLARGTTSFVIDSGVLKTTRDLNFARNSSWHRSWIGGQSPFADGSGHGTHVAGTIAARANGTGFVGVAPGSNVVSLKVFGSTGGAAYSTIIDALNHAVTVIKSNGLNRNKAVINMSLSGPFYGPMHTATRNAANQGIRLSVAAGNSGRNAKEFSPAAAGNHRNVYTVSAADNNYQMPWWSNWDSTATQNIVDYAAPGVDILSYGSNSRLTYKSGTSMAAPHVAGLLLMGGIRRAPRVQEYWTGTADHFVWGSSSLRPPQITGAGRNRLVQGFAKSYTVRGHNADPLSEVRILRGTQVLGRTKSTIEGAFSYRLTPENIERFGQGSGKRVRARQTDGAGNTRTSANYQFSIDTTNATSRRDRLTGELNRGDRFTWRSISDTLLDRYDTITNFQTNDRLVIQGERYRSSIRSSEGRIRNLNARRINKILGGRTFSAGDASAFQVRDQRGTFIVLNDNRDGFQAKSDAVLFLEAYNINQSANTVTVI